MSTNLKTVLAVVVCAAAGLVTGAVARPAAPTIVETTGYHPADTATATVVGQRVTDYWQARTRLDLPAAYQFYEASFRSTYAPEAFVKTFQRLNRFAPELVRVDRIDLDAAGTRAKVVVTLRSKPPVLEGEALMSTLEDVWIFADGQWWRQAEAMTPAI